MPAEPAPPRRARLAVTLCFLGNGLLFSTWVSRIPAVQARHELTPGTLGLLLLGLGLGAVVAMPLAGWASTRFGSRSVTWLCGIASVLLLPALAAAPDPWALALAMMLFGAMNGAFDVAMNAQAVAVEARYGRPLMSTFHALWSTGGLLGAAAGGALAGAGIQPLAHFAGAAALIAFGLYGGGLPWLLSPEPAAPREESAHLPRRVPVRLVALGAIAFCVMMGEGAMADWSALLLRDALGATEALAATGYAAFSVAMALGRFTGDGLTARLGPVRLLRLSGILAASGLLLALSAEHPPLALLGFIGVGAGFATVVPVVFSAAGRTPGLSPAAALSVTTTLGYAGFLAGPPLIGFLAGAHGLRAALGAVLATSAVIALLAPLVGNPPARR